MQQKNIQIFYSKPLQNAVYGWKNMLLREVKASRQRAVGKLNTYLGLNNDLLTQLRLFF
ncbi:hypothetical protein D3C78_970040 [compost metagenome]